MLQDYYPHLLAFHNLLRWIAIAAALAAVVIAISGWDGKKSADGKLKSVSKLFVIAMDLSFLTGIVLYFFASPITRQALNDFGAAMKAYESRFFAVEHSTMMILAVVAAHVGAVIIRKGKTDQKKYRGAAIAFSISLLCMLAMIPWFRPLLRMP